ncbi:MAG: hypothetical protein L0287_20695 [Anaerolineae bacterium]|nr:hypothetical protein [Anaerolineae bacterium]
MKRDLPQIPGVQNMADMLAVLASPDAYNKKLTELRSFLTLIDTRLGAYREKEALDAYDVELRKRETVVAQQEALSRQTLSELLDKEKRLNEFEAQLNSKQEQLRRDEEKNVRSNQEAHDSVEQEKADIRKEKLELSRAVDAYSKESIRHEQHKQEYRNRVETLNQAINAFLVK